MMISNPSTVGTSWDQPADYELNGAVMTSAALERVVNQATGTYNEW